MIHQLWPWLGLLPLDLGKDHLPQPWLDMLAIFLTTFYFYLCVASLYFTIDPPPYRYQGISAQPCYQDVTVAFSITLCLVSSSLSMGLAAVASFWGTVFI